MPRDNFDNIPLPLVSFGDTVATPPSPPPQVSRIFWMVPYNWITTSAVLNSRSLRSHGLYGWSRYVRFDLVRFRLYWKLQTNHLTPTNEQDFRLIMFFSGIKRSMMAKQNSLDDVGLELDGDDQVQFRALLRVITARVTLLNSMDVSQHYVLSILRIKCWILDYLMDF